MSRKNSLASLRRILEGLGSPSPFDEYADDGQARAALARKFCEVVDEYGLSQEEVHFRTGVTPRMLSRMHDGELQNISLKRLMRILVIMDQHVEIVVRPARMTFTSGITVAA